MPGTTRTWLVVATVLVAATVATANVETGELGEYYMKRSQEARFRRGGPLHDIISAAHRYHQNLFSSRYGSGRRYLLEEGEAAAGAEAPADSTGDATPIHNTLRDHEMMGA
ncbi:hypothetical protein CFC21_065355 [Triticum aestivum]|uniref:Uncharacterized protein n=4 Tax=Triticum TaxID=4564 RepID=A0A9R0TSE3_TRITD|nr:uncharacterized protein LOC123106893 [Triticum aestivum]XP_048527335.1 uncharacterized protein LOC125506591 [Triticum urartu]KAF7058253.1 hypothetical protein CFC21_065355 [Triticum aestivum]VAI16440.1 unnamed protein product [Triticum turgidum subsp. durum]